MGALQATGQAFASSPITSEGRVDMTETYTLCGDPGGRPDESGLTLAEAGARMLEIEADARGCTYMLRYDGRWWHLVETKRDGRSHDTVVFVQADDEDAAWRAVHEAVALHKAWDRLMLLTDADYAEMRAESL